MRSLEDITRDVVDLFTKEYGEIPFLGIAFILPSKDEVQWSANTGYLNAINLFKGTAEHMIANPPKEETLYGDVPTEH
jgi:hypothetical protein